MALRILFLLGTLVCLLQLWIPEYFLTGDGPCHLYNSEILRQLWQNENVGFYNRFFELRETIDPNWFDHLALVGLLHFFNGVVAEKVLLTIYIIIFVSGFRILLLRFNDKGGLATTLIIFLFVFHMPMIKGFFNFTISVAFFLWLLWSWLYYVEKRNVRSVLFLLIVTPLAFFSHPVGFLYAFMVSGCLLAGHMLHLAIRKESVRKLFFDVFVMILVYGPYFFILDTFVKKNDAPVYILPHNERLISFLNFDFLLNYGTIEYPFIRAAAYILLSLAIIAIIFSVKRSHRPGKYIGLWFALLVSFIFYYLLPDQMSGGSMLTMRTQVLTYIILVLCIASSPLPGRLVKYFSLGVFLAFISLFVVRLPTALKASDGVADYLSCRSVIPPRSVILPLSFSHNGKDREGELICDGNWLFMHAAQYLGAYEPLILLDNYEPNMDYFPFSWQPLVNSYLHLSKEEGIEGQPPYADIDGYERDHGVIIDYVVTWCYTDDMVSIGHVSELMEQLRRKYTVIYMSPSHRTVLYKRN